MLDLDLQRSSDQSFASAESNVSSVDSLAFVPCLTHVTLTPQSTGTDVVIIPFDDGDPKHVAQASASAIDRWSLDNDY